VVQVKEVARGWKELHNEEIHRGTSSCNIVIMEARSEK
jgi:hypothetical protein